MARVEFSEDDCDWVYSTFMHRIELLEEYLTDEPDNADMREELRAAESVVSAIRKSGYRTTAERRRGGGRDREDFHADDAVGYVAYGEDGPYDD
jgi:hypothetical protein